MSHSCASLDIAHSKASYSSASTTVTCNLIYDTLDTFDLQISINKSITRRIRSSVKEKFGWQPIQYLEVRLKIFNSVSVCADILWSWVYLKVGVGSVSRSEVGTGTETTCWLYHAEFLMFLWNTEGSSKCDVNKSVAYWYSGGSRAHRQVYWATGREEVHWGKSQMCYYTLLSRIISVA
jgi:hypothetical protein